MGSVLPEGGKTSRIWSPEIIKDEETAHQRLVLEFHLACDTYVSTHQFDSFIVLYSFRAFRSFRRSGLIRRYRLIRSTSGFSRTNRSEEHTSELQSIMTNSYPV